MRTLENNPEAVEPEEITAPQIARMFFHLLDCHSAYRGCADQRSDAGPGVDSGLDAKLRERAQHSNVSEALESSAAEDERDLSPPDAGLGFSFSGRCERIRQVGSVRDRYNCIELYTARTE